jgi:hypothetical protein
MSRPLAPGEGARPVRKKHWKETLRGTFDRLRFRAPREAYVVRHHPDDAAVRRVALLRMWDLGHRIEFVADPDVSATKLRVHVPGETSERTGTDAGRALVTILPGFWWMYPWCLVPGLQTLAGRVVLRTFEFK